MKIIQAVNWYFPKNLGGMEVYVDGLCQRLAAAGHQVEIVVPDGGIDVPQTHTHEGLLVFRYPVPSDPVRDEALGWHRTPGAEHLHRRLRTHPPDVFHLHGFGRGLSLPEIRVARQAGARIVATNHLPALGYTCMRGDMMQRGQTLCNGVAGPTKCADCLLQSRGVPRPAARVLASLPLPASRLALRLLPGSAGTALGLKALLAKRHATQQALYDWIDRYVLLNEWARQVLLENGAPPRKLEINRLGMSHTESAIKRDPRSTCQPVRVGYLGRFMKIKGLHVLARALADLPPEVPVEVEFRGPDRDSLTKELRAVAGHDPRVRFEPPIPSREVSETLAGYDVLCCPSVCFENGPTVMLEAQAVGTPVIGSRIGGMAETIRDGVDGALFEPGDWKALRDLLRRIAEDPAGTVDHWRRNLRSPRTMDEVATDYLSLYNRVWETKTHSDC